MDLLNGILAEWSTTHQLTWYRKYNEVKHDRKKKFDRASLENVINAVGSVFCIVSPSFTILRLRNTGLPRAMAMVPMARYTAQTCFSVLNYLNPGLQVNFMIFNGQSYEVKGGKPFSITLFPPD